MSDNPPVIEGQAEALEEEKTPEQLAAEAEAAARAAFEAEQLAISTAVGERAWALASGRGGEVRGTGRLGEGRWACILERDGAFEVHELANPPVLVRVRASFFEAEQVLHRLMEGRSAEDIPGEVEPGPAPTPYGSSPEARLEWVKDEAKRRIDREAELARLRYVTPGAGQAMAYKAKEEEARMIVAFAPGVDLDAPSFPFLALEAEATGQTLRQVAGVVVAAADLWRHVGARIEVLRLSAKRAVEAAATEAEARAAARVDWP
jgi:hypothetical protein